MIVALALSPFVTVPIVNTFDGPVFPISPLSPLSPFGPLILTVCGFGKLPSLLHDRSPLVATLGVNIVPVSPFSPFSPCGPCGPVSPFGP